MRKLAGRLLYLVTSLSLLLSCRTSGGNGHEETRPRVATLIAANGAVQVLRSGAVDWVALESGAQLFDDDRLRTFKRATAQLAFPNGSSLRVDEESLISLGAPATGPGIVVERGSVEGELQPGLKLRTPAAEAETASPRELVFQ